MDPQVANITEAGKSSSRKPLSDKAIQYLSILEDLSLAKFYTIDFEASWTLPGGKCGPCELGIIEFNIQEGEKRCFYRVIDPGMPPSGASKTAAYATNMIHGINRQWFLPEHANYFQLWSDLIDFIDRTCPILFAKGPAMETAGLAWIAGKCRVRDIPWQVEDLDSLSDFFQDMHPHTPVHPSSRDSTKFFKEASVTLRNNGKCRDHRSMKIDYHCALQDSRMCVLHVREIAFKFGVIEDYVMEPNFPEEKDGPAPIKGDAGW